MINNRTLKCTSCDTLVRTRTAMGHGTLQEHGFQCPKCSVLIRYTVRHDPSRYDELVHRIGSPVRVSLERREHPAEVIDEGLKHGKSLCA